MSRVVLVVRCAGRRVVEVREGDPAPVSILRKTERYVLMREWLILAPWADRPIEEGVDFRVVDIEVPCPNHRDGHAVAAPRLRHLYDLQHQGTRAVDIRDVEPPPA